MSEPTEEPRPRGRRRDYVCKNGHHTAFTGTGAEHRKMVHEGKCRCGEPFTWSMPL